MINILSVYSSEYNKSKRKTDANNPILSVTVLNVQLCIIDVLIDLSLIWGYKHVFIWVKVVEQFQFSIEKN